MRRDDDALMCSRCGCAYAAEYAQVFDESEPRLEPGDLCRDRQGSKVCNGVLVPYDERAQRKLLSLRGDK